MDEATKKKAELKARYKATMKAKRHGVPVPAKPSKEEMLMNLCGDNPTMMKIAHDMIKNPKAGPSKYVPSPEVEEEDEEAPPET